MYMNSEAFEEPVDQDGKGMLKDYRNDRTVQHAGPSKTPAHDQLSFNPQLYSSVDDLVAPDERDFRYKVGITDNLHFHYLYCLNFQN